MAAGAGKDISRQPAAFILRADNFIYWLRSYVYGFSPAWDAMALERAQEPDAGMDLPDWRGIEPRSSAAATKRNSICYDGICVSSKSYTDLRILTMKNIIGARFQSFVKPASMGVVNDTYYRRCYWPSLDRPTPLFADGSKGIIVEGPPTPRNVVFPPDTVFAEYWPDALYPAEQAVMKVSKGRRGMVNLSDEEAAIYVAAYDEAVKSFPPTQTKHTTRADCHFLRHKEVLRTYQVIVRDERGVPVLKDGKPVEFTKEDCEFYIAELLPEESTAFLGGKVSEDELRTSKEFCLIDDDPNDPDARKANLATDGTLLPIAIVVGG